MSRGFSGQSSYLQGAGVQCALVYESQEESSAIIESVCRPEDIGRNCNIDGRAISETCNSADPLWYQKAIYVAAGRNDSGLPVGHSPAPRLVVFGAGEIEISRVLRAHYPMADSTAIHVPSGIFVRGSRDADRPTIVRTAEVMTKDDGSILNDRLGSLILISDERVPFDIRQMAPVVNAGISDFTLSGLASLDLKRSVHASDSEIKVSRGIYAMGSSGFTQIQRLKIFHVFGMAIETGAYSYFLAAIRADDHNATCQDGSCLAHIQRFNGGLGDVCVARNCISDNEIFDARFGGISVIGESVDIFNNRIEVSDRYWRSSDQKSGSTMGISASFLGTNNMTVHHNTTTGGDYSIGSDGSLPIYFYSPSNSPSGIYDYYWRGEIYPALSRRTSASFYNSPLSPVRQNGNVVFANDQDRIIANQLILDALAERNRMDLARAEMGFGANIQVYDNLLRDAVVGISLYRQRTWDVHDNEISASPGIFNRDGILIVDSHNNFLYRNYITNYNFGIEVLGKGIVTNPLGQITFWGSSFNGIGVRYWSDQSGDHWEHLGNRISLSGSASSRAISMQNQPDIQQIVGLENEVRMTVIENPPTVRDFLCVYTQGRRNGNTLDFTTDNTFLECDRDF